ncbi:MAG: 3-oxoacyl-[acyl-carrier-protein] synthase-3 [Planctomycetota bacterium]|jgi:3-oxoacyl-[acyl-carrier-protein] synthase III
MRFENVSIEGLGFALPPEAVTSDALEERLQPLYDRLGASVGRLELMSGIRERRFWPEGTRPSDASILAGREALEHAGIDRERIGCLIHSSVCRDFMEPATASVVHAGLGLPPTAEAFDLSNACLGFANAMALVAGRIERREIEAALVVSGEDGGPLVRQTIAALLAGKATRKDLKRAYASLTIGSGGAAMVLCHADIAKRPHRLLGGVVRAATQHHELCSGGQTDGAAGPLMDTDSEALLHAGNTLAQETWPIFLEELDWTADDADRIVTHQVGVAHKRLLFETLGLDHARDFTTVETLGNVGSVSLPATLTLGVRDGFIQPGHRVAMQGIGSGLHCMMLGLQW